MQTNENIVRYKEERYGIPEPALLIIKLRSF